MALNIPTEGTKLNELKINIVDTQETFEAMKTANKVNANELYLKVDVNNKVAIDLYIKFGVEILEKQYKWRRIGQNNSSIFL